MTQMQGIAKLIGRVRTSHLVTNNSNLEARNTHLISEGGSIMFGLTLVLTGVYLGGFDYEKNSSFESQLIPNKQILLGKEVKPVCDPFHTEVR